MKQKFWIFFIAIFLLLVLTFVDTYGLLESEGSADVSESIGKWHITLNDVDVTLNNTLSFDDLIYEENENVEPGFFAPGTECSYTIEVNPNDTDVSIRYDISADLEWLAEYPNISFSITSEEEISLNDGVYTGLIPLSEIQNDEIISLQISLIWENDEEYNETDNQLIEDMRVFSIPITMTFSQYLGEEI